MADNVLTSIRSRFRLFKQPHQIGDVIDVNDTPHLLIGIEDFEIRSDTIIILYTAQRLDITDFISMRKAYEQTHVVEFEVKMKHDDNRWNAIKLGRLHLAKDGICYKTMEWTEIKLKGTDLYVSFSARPIHPIDRKEAKAKLFSERRKKLKLEVL